MKVNQLIDSIASYDLVLPEFQREYVWTKEQAKQLLVSLIKDYPVGGLLFWKTDSPPELKNLSNPPEQIGTIDIILDGQQRLTTLYMLMTGKIPPYYLDQDIQYDPRDLFFNIDSGEFQYYQATRMKENPLWVRVIDCYTDPDINEYEIAEKLSQGDEPSFKLAKKYGSNLTDLRQIRERDLPIQVVPIHATIDEAIDIFDKVNSQGTKLTDAELALTHVTGKWPKARREMKKKIEELSKRNFTFDLNFMTRALTGVVTKHALFEHIHKTPKEELLDGWKNLNKILDYLVTILPPRASIDTTDDVNTNNAFIPLIVYLSLQDNQFHDETSIKQAVHWLYAALMWARYTGQTDQRLEHDVSLVVRYPNPWDALREQIVDQRGRIEVKDSDFEGRGSQHPLYRTTYVIAKAHGAIDWFNGVPLGSGQGKNSQWHSHHIFPASLLYENGYDSDNHLHRKIVNEIANRAFITAETNIDLSNSAPVDYFPVIESKFPGALVKQFIPMNPELWKVDHYEDFLQARRELMARKVNEYMQSLIAVPQETHERKISELITFGESATLEFKSTLQWDVITGQQNKELRLSVIKTLAAFLNSEGGTLIIGVEDNGGIYGLSKDLKFVKGHGLDGFEQLLMGLLKDHIGPEYAHYIKVRFEKQDGEYVCAVDVDKAPNPAFVNGYRGKEFFVRMGNTTQSLDPEEAHSYIQMNWE